jgi:hypothetical protein
VGKPSKRYEMMLNPQFTLQEFDKWSLKVLVPTNPQARRSLVRYIIIATKYLNRWAREALVIDCTPNTVA